MYVVPFSALHLEMMDLFTPGTTPEGMRLRGHQFEVPGASITLLSPTPVACGGLVPLGERRWMAWAAFSPTAPGPVFANAVRKMRSLLNDTMPFRGRVEAYILDGFAQGERLASMMGFERETARPMREFLPGQDYHLFARIT